MRYSSFQYFMIIAGACGIFFGHTNPFFHIPLLLLLTPCCLFLLSITASDLRQTLLSSWLCCLIGYSASLYWIAVPIHDIGELPYFLAIPCVILLASYLSCFGALSSLFIRTFSQILPSTNLPYSLFLVIFSGTFFAATEWLTAYIFTGFPWLPLSAGFALQPSWIQIVSLVGVNGLSAIFSIGSCCLALSLVVNQKKIIIALFGIIVISFPPAYGYLRLTYLPHLDTEKKVSIGLIQGNVNQNQKWEPQYQLSTIHHYLQLSKELLDEENSSDSPLQMILWPETSMPFFYQESNSFSLLLKEFSNRYRVYLGFGTLGLDFDPEEKNLLFNRFQVINKEGKNAGHYDKQHLVPFGEYIPFNLDFKFLTNILQGVAFTGGKIDTPLKLFFSSSSNGKGITFSAKSGILICYEDIFPDLAQSHVSKGANFLINISNDAWFGKTSAPEQHLSLAIMRSVEQQRSTIRSTNTGISGGIDPYGKLMQPSAIFTVQKSIITIPFYNTKTIYHRIKKYLDLFFIACLVFGVVITAYSKTRKTKIHNYYTQLCKNLLHH